MLDCSLQHSPPSRLAAARSETQGSNTCPHFAPYEGPSQEREECRVSPSGVPLLWDLSSSGVQHPSWMGLLSSHREWS